MDPQIEELKELVRQNIAVSTETNKIVHGMRNAGRVKSFFWFIIVLLSIASSVYTYYVYVAPRLGQLIDLYTNVESSIQQAQNLGSKAESVFSNFGGSTTTPQQ